MAELTGHTSRVLHLAQSPDGETVVSGAADETLRFWKVFGPVSLCCHRLLPGSPLCIWQLHLLLLLSCRSAVLLRCASRSLISSHGLSGQAQVENTPPGR